MYKQNIIKSQRQINLASIHPTLCHQKSDYN